MSQRFAQGGPVAREALGEILTGLQQLDDPMQRQQVGLALFKTRWEDAKTAIQAADLPTAASELGNVTGATRDAATAIGLHADGWDKLGRNIDATMTKAKEWLADSAIGKFFGQGLPGFLDDAFFNDAQDNAQAALDEALARARAENNAASIGGHAGNTPTLIAPVDRHDPIPMIPGSESGGKADKPDIPLSQYSLDAIPFGKFGNEGGIQAPGRKIESHTGPGFYEFDPEKYYDAQSQEISAHQRVEEARRRVLEVEADNDHTEGELQDAKNNALQADRAYLKAAQDVVDAQNGTWKKIESSAKSFSDGMGDIGAQLDEDFGVSQGLPGIAENITKFLGSLAFAPVVGALRGVQAGLGYPNGAAGSGVAGMIGSAMGMAGPGQAIGGQTTANSSASFPGGGTNPNVKAMLSLAQWASGRTQYAAASDLINGLADCSGSISDLYEVLTTGQSNSGRQFSTTNFASDAEAAKLGFLPGYQPGAFNIGVNPYPGQSGHMAATLPNGVNFEGSGGTGGGAQYGGSAAGAMDPQFEKQYYLPVGGSPGQYPTIQAPAASAGGGVIGAPNGGYSPLSPTELTNPGLTSPIPTGSGGMGTGAVGPGMAAPPSGIGAFTGPASDIGGRELGAGTPASGGLNFSGGIIGMAGGAVTSAIGAAGMAGGMGMDGGAGGAIASAAAQIGIQEGMRAISYAGQLAGIGASGLLETFSLNESALADPGKSWLGRIAMGVAGARPALPNSAGASGGQDNKNMAESGKGGNEPPGPMDPTKLENGAAGGAGSEGKSGSGSKGDTTINNHVTVTPPDQTRNNIAQSTADALYASQSAGQ